MLDCLVLVGRKYEIQININKIEIMKMNKNSGNVIIRVGNTEQKKKR